MRTFGYILVGYLLVAAVTDAVTSNVDTALFCGLVGAFLGWQFAAPQGPTDHPPTQDR